MLLEEAYPGRGVWRALVPLIRLEIVEWHQPDRVMRQFGCQQFIPRPAFWSEELHKVDKRKNVDGDWVTYYQPLIDCWGDRSRRVVTSPPMPVMTRLDLSVDSMYMVWYSRITRRWMCVAGAARSLAVSIINCTLSSTSFRYI